MVPTHVEYPVCPDCSRTSLGPDRRSNGQRRTRRFLIPFLLIGILAAEPPSPDPERSGTDASQAAESAISVDELARRLQRLEKQNTKLAQQNDKLAEQNANLSARSQSLSEKLDEITKLCDQLNRRLENPSPAVGCPPFQPSAFAPFPIDQRPGFTPDSPPPLDSPFAPYARLPEGTELQSGALFPSSAPQPEPGSPESTTLEAIDTSRNAEPGPSWLSKFWIGGYDQERGGFILVRSKDTQHVPFELRLDLVTQVRYTNLAPSANTWIDSTGTPQPIHRISSWELNRNFIQFSGFALDPRLQFMAILFSSTAIDETVLLGYIGYHFNDAFDLRAGNWLVPGTREWYTSFRYTLGADRLMATTFFRPNISPGIWAQGEPIKGFNYVAMLANSLNRFNQGIDRIGSTFAFGGTAWWEPLGAFGPGPSDIENHQSLSTRLGVNLALSREANQGSIFNDGVITQPLLPNPEDTIIRLSDGTPLFRPDALGPGVTLTAANVQLWTVDAAFKYRGLSLDSEYFFRWLDGFNSVGKAPAFASLFDFGALLQGGCFWIPTKLESYARSSVVSGRFGTGSEFGAGMNWYPKGSRNWRLTSEVLYLNHCPADNALTGYRAGESGTLVQLQCFTDF
ncbi:MAG TPA: hypothetical protein VH592_11060 [Gemmataceae bacterium]|jgi:hypothetical protein